MLLSALLRIPTAYLVLVLPAGWLYDKTEQLAYPCSESKKAKKQKISFQPDQQADPFYGAVQSPKPTAKLKRECILEDAGSTTPFEATKSLSS